MGNSEREENLMLEMMFALGGMFFFGALTGWVADHLPEKLAEWMEIHIFRCKKKAPREAATSQRRIGKTFNTIVAEREGKVNGK